MPKQKLIVMVGPTASGKSALAVRLAQKFDGEIVSADSRQVYRGMNIGSGKITKKEMHGVPHYLLDVASPKRKWTIVQYRKLALRAMQDILGRERVPFLVGGTGFYILAVIDGIVIPEVKPDWKLRTDLEKLETKKLFRLLKKLDPKRAKTIEQKNPRRLIRAIEIVIKTKKPVPALKKKRPSFEVLMIGLWRSQKELRSSIRKRLLMRLRKGMVAEVKKLRKQGLSWERLEEFGLEYRYVAQYLQRKLGHQEMLEKIQKESEHYAERQMTWFKRDKRIHWILNQKQAEKLAKEFLRK